ncbi:MAG: serine/threonine-protein kinase [Myxococcaceae bacterium]
MLEPGSRLSDYEVWGRIGGGGMSDVFLARHTHLCAPVIIKTLKLSLEGAPAERTARLRTEAMLTARIRSPRVVRPLDFGLTPDDAPYMVQDYVDGLDGAELDSLRRRAVGRGLPLWYVCEVTSEVAQALAAAHRTGVLHRDLKPSNLFVSPEEGVQLGDFGVAVAKGNAGGDTPELAGTLEYMAPETLRAGVFDRRTDLYGLGATAFQLRYGRPPFGSTRETLDPEARPAFPRPESPEEAYFQQALAQMLAREPGERWADAERVVGVFSRLSSLVHRPLAVSRDAAGLHVGGVLLTTRADDIARAQADGIVCSANSELSMEVGVADALRRAGGQIIVDETRAIGSQPLGACISTTAGALQARRVLHAVSAWNEVSCVARATQRVFLRAEAEGLRTLAVPAVGTGAARVSLEAAATSLAMALELHLRLGGSQFQRIDFVLFDDAKKRVFDEVLDSIFLGRSGESTDDGLVDAGAMTDSSATIVRK